MRGVQLAVGEPLVEGRVRVVEHLGRLDEPVEVAGLLRPPGLGVAAASLVQRLVARRAPRRRTPAGGSKRSLLEQLAELALEVGLRGVADSSLLSFHELRLDHRPWTARYPLRRVLPDRPCSSTLADRLRRDLRRHRPRPALDRGDAAGAAPLRHRPARRAARSRSGSSPARSRSPASPAARSPGTSPTAAGASGSWSAARYSTAISGSAAASSPPASRA